MGTWDTQWSQKHIHILELQTVFLAIQMLKERLARQSIQIMVDNTSAVAYVRRQGGTRSPSLLKVAHNILTLCFQHQIQIQLRHIKGQLNVLADLASRQLQVIPSEWALSESNLR